MRRRVFLREYVAAALAVTGLFRRSIASRTGVAYRSRLPIQNPDDVPSAKSKSHSNMVTTPPLLNVCGDPTVAITVPPSPAPIFPHTPPPSGIPPKSLTLTTDTSSCGTDSDKAPSEIDMPCLRERQTLSEHWQLPYKTRFSFRYRVHDVDELCIVSTESFCTQNVLVCNTEVV